VSKHPLLSEGRQVRCLRSTDPQRNEKWKFSDHEIRRMCVFRRGLLDVVKSTERLWTRRRSPPKISWIDATANNHTMITFLLA